MSGQFARRAPGQRANFPTHVRLVGIPQIGSDLRQPAGEQRTGMKFQKPLKAHHLLELLWTIAYGADEVTVQLALADIETVRQIRNPPLRFPGQPVDRSLNQTIGAAASLFATGQFRFNAVKHESVEFVPAA